MTFLGLCRVLMGCLVGGLVAVPQAAFANQTGINGRSGKNSGRFCASCHTGGSYGAVVNIVGPAQLFTNQRATYSVTVTATGAVAAGFNAAVENLVGAPVPADPAADPLDDDDGTLFAIEAGTQLLAGEVTHTAPRLFDGATSVTFQFDWEPHAPGNYQIYAAGNAVDKTGTDQNDHPALYSTAAVVSVCDDPDYDGVCNDGSDNCPLVANPKEGPSQSDCDNDGLGDACDSNCTSSALCTGLCYPGTCGDGRLDAPTVEDCDDGNTTDDGNGCSAGCLINSICGDQIVQAVSETCDQGSANSDTAADACRSDCQFAHCGDGVVDTGEACDDGNTADNGNGCDAACQVNAVCGDSVVQSQAEDCDDGNAADDGNGCSPSCTNNSVCGDSVIAALFESCDDGDSVDSGNGCSVLCLRNDLCGDGNVAALFEECDDGDTSDDGNGCNGQCLRNDVCGDGVWASLFEECDEGLANSDTLPGACRTNCLVAFCGDGAVDAGEACDDGAANSDTVADACRIDCTLARCGDGVVDGTEACDDGVGNANNVADACRTNCEEPACGDTVLDPLFGEGCDDGDVLEGDGCSATCASEQCGDGVTNGHEQCDSGLANSDTTPNACRSSCLNAHCGDGVADLGEECDDGADNSNAVANACRKDCVQAHCGDGVVDRGEDCDPAVSRGSCANDCTIPSEDEGCNATGMGVGAWLLGLLALLRVFYWRRSSVSSI